jgi:hypothetical protein
LTGLTVADVYVVPYVNEGGANVGDTYAAVVVTAAGLQAIFSATLNLNNAIVVVAACHGAEGPGGGAGVQAGSVVDLIGGRLAVGYIGTVLDSWAQADLDKFFGRMNGKLPSAVPGSERLANNAYSKPDAGSPAEAGTNKPYLDHNVTTMPSYDRSGSQTAPDVYFPSYTGPVKFVMRNSTDDTTLCPAIAVTVTYASAGTYVGEPTSATANVVPADGTVTAPLVGGLGNGSVQFDTHCDNTIAANTIVSAAFGMCQLINIDWDADGHGGKVDDKIVFQYQKCAGWISSWLQAVKVDATKVTGMAGILHLDGNTSPLLIRSGGVAPNGDSFYWFFAHP